MNIIWAYEYWISSNLKWCGTKATPLALAYVVKIQRIDT
jgi:hypothetical protein